MSYTIYLRTNKVNGKQYVGQTGDFERREKEWRYLKQRYANSYINDDREKYGLDNFNVVIIDHCETQEEAYELEKKYINELGTKFPNGYNMTDGGKSGYDICEESKKKMSENNAKYWLGKLSPRRGKHHSEEAKIKMSEARKGKHYSQKTEFPKRKVNQYDSKGNFIKQWQSFADIKRKLGYNIKNIQRCCKGGYFDKKKNKWINCNTSYGSIWKYAKEDD